jgi:acetyl esterase
MTFIANREPGTWSDTALGMDRDQLPVRVYRGLKRAGSVPLVLHLHGGAFCDGSLDGCAVVPGLLVDAGAVVVSADYPLAPRHQFPHALHTIFDALKSLSKSRARFGGKASRLFVAGEEAGGNLAASLALMARDQHEPGLAGQILLSPMLDPCLATTSIRSADAGPAGCKWADGWQHYLGSPEKAAHPYAAPSESSRLSGLAPALVVTAQDDPMRDESLCYARRLQESGVFVRQHVLSAPTGWPGVLCSDQRSEASWATALRDQFIQFFAESAALLRPSASYHVVHA